MSGPTTTDPVSLPLCGKNLDGTPRGFQTTPSGFTMCAGTPGEGMGSSSHAPETTQVPNATSNQAAAYYGFYNKYDSSNPCIITGVPTGSPLTFDDAKVPYTSAQGCCSTYDAWVAVDQTPADNSARRTRLTPFTTASALGANDAAGLADGLPPDLQALTKSWGTSPSHWMHGGVHAGNVGVWGTQPGHTPFTVKTPVNGQSWTQDRMLWCRLTGDNYDPDQDPYGTTAPAPPGTVVLKTSSKLPYPCKGCDTNPLSGQVRYLPTGNRACVNPYGQICKNTEPCTPANMMKDFATTTLPWDPTTNNGYMNPKGRVGGVFASRDMYGPGKFTILANLPPTAVPSSKDPIAVPGFPRVDATTGAYPQPAGAGSAGGRGYVFAMWTFWYAEAYQNPDNKQVSNHIQPHAAGAATLCQPSIPNKDESSFIESSALSTTQCGLSDFTSSVEVIHESSMSNATVTFPDLPGLISGCPDAGILAAHNHEIDIEIPANSFQYAGPAMMDTLTLQTANFNTWLSDTDHYNGNALTMYQQAQATAPPGVFFAAVGPEDDQDTFHEYSFVWHVATPEEEAAKGASASYVAFYLDGTEVFRCRRFVPRRSGRVLIGLWPAWWGSNYNNLTFNQVYAKIARMEFVPQVDETGNPLPGMVTTGAQTYDQVFPLPVGSGATEIACGFEAPVKREIVVVPTSVLPPAPAPAKAPATARVPAPAPATVASKGWPIWLIIVVAIVAAGIVAAIVAPVVMEYKKRQRIQGQNS